jgi:hypothetical protein
MGSCWAKLNQIKPKINVDNINQNTNTNYVLPKEKSEFYYTPLNILNGTIFLFL